MKLPGAGLACFESNTNARLGSRGEIPVHLIYVRSSLVVSNHDGSITAADQKGLLIGDYNENGLQDLGEDVLFISTADALTLLSASAKQTQDARFVLGRDVVATW